LSLTFVSLTVRQSPNRGVYSKRFLTISTFAHTNGGIALNFRPNWQ